jgi:Putative polyhydroxyalkanoic acid system protein (PHA_gran_rgn)
MLRRGTDVREPIVITISHRLGRDEAKRRLEEGLTHIRGQLAPFVQAIDYAWDGYRLEFSVTAILQAVSGHIDIEDQLVRVEIALPLLLRMLSKAITGRIQNEGTRLLGKAAE